jgi:hypothetical protein
MARIVPLDAPLRAQPETTMTALLSLLADGALAAAELLALLFISPAMATEPVHVAAQPIALHRLTTALDVRLLGTLADVRVLHRVRNDGERAVDLGAALPTGEHVDTVRVVRGGRAVEFGASVACGDDLFDRAQPTLDEAIADALTLAPGAEAMIEATGAQTLVRDGNAWRVALPASVESNRARALLVDQGDARFIVVIPHVAARTASLVLRPANGAAERYELGSADSRSAIVVPLASRVQFDALAAGAIELTLNGDRATVWTTIVGEVADASASVQARVGE